MCAISGFDPFPEMSLRELIAATVAKQKCDWDHTADMIAMNATIHCRGSYRREHFHPMRELPFSASHVDDPAATYKALKEEEERSGNHT